MKLYIIPRSIRDSIQENQVRAAKLDPPHTSSFLTDFTSTFKERFGISEVNKEASIELIRSVNREENMWFLVLEKQDDWSLEYIVP